MKVIRIRNVNDAFHAGLQLLQESGEQRGDVIACPEPVTTIYSAPLERVSFDRTRDANPFLHLFEALWILGGRCDLDYVEQFAKTEQTMWGASGWRYRSFFNFDQLFWVINRLRKSSSDRCAVLQIWSAGLDQQRVNDGGNDVPCNLSIHFQVQAGVLNMTVFNRSFNGIGSTESMLQEYVAAAVGVPIGCYWQVSTNYYMHVSDFKKMQPNASGDPYVAQEVTPMPLMSSTRVWETWDQDLAMFLDKPLAMGFRHAFFRKIAKPMMAAHTAYVEDRFNAAMEALSQMPEGNDWRRACEEWVERRRSAQDES